MPPREPPTGALGADNSVDIAEVEARAEAARARATLLREQAEAASGDLGDPISQKGVEEEADDAEEAPFRRRRLRRPGRKTWAVAAAIVVTCAALTGSGYLVWHHHQVVQERQRSAEYATAARTAIVAMMSIDANKARDDLQRFADQTTGQFKASVLMGAEDMLKALEQSKTVSKASVQAVAVQSMTEDSAVVLVAAKSERIKPDQTKTDTRSWRVVVDVEREGGQLKISKVEYVP
jgi:Mce-associated membrane protein